MTDYLEQRYEKVAVDHLLKMLTSAHASFADEQAALARAREVAISAYDKWEWRNEWGRPVQQFLTRAEQAETIIYHDVPKLVSRALGEAFEKQDISQAKLTDHGQSRLRHPLKHLASQFVQRRRTPDYTSLNTRMRHVDEEYQRALNGFIEKTNPSSHGEWLTKNIAALDRMIERTESVAAEFKSEPRYGATMFIPSALWRHIDFKDAEWAERLIGRDLDIGVQYDRRYNLFLLEQIENYIKIDAEARPDPAFLDKLVETATTTIIGRQMFEWNKEHKTPILFIDLPAAENVGCAATYNASDDIIRVVRSRDTAAEDVAGSVLHELDHRRQQHEFPKIFERMNDVDRFIAEKLAEARSGTVNALHALEKAIERKNGSITVPNVQIGLTIELDQKTRDDVLGMSSGSEPARILSVDPYLLVACGNFLEVLRHSDTMSHYELKMASPGFIDAVKSGTFEAQVANSPFLTNEFLKEFCRLPNGGAFLIEDHDRIRNEIVKEISTLHHPMLLHVASEGRAFRDANTPIRHDRQMSGTAAYPSHDPP